MRGALGLALLAACGDGAVATVRVTAYGRSQCGTSSLSPAIGAEIRSYDAAVDADHGNNTFATATTDADGIAMLSVPYHGYIVYRPCPGFLESIQGVENGDDLVVGDPTQPPACLTFYGHMTVAFPTIANATYFQVNDVSSQFPNVPLDGCDGAQFDVLAQAWDNNGQPLGDQFQTATFAVGSTLQVGPLVPLSTLDVSVAPPPPDPLVLSENVGNVAFAEDGSSHGAGSYRFVFPRFAPTALLRLEGDDAEITFPTDQSAVTADLAQLAQPPYVATRTIGEAGGITDDLQPSADYLIDTPPGIQPSLSFLPFDLPAPTDEHNYNVFHGYAIKDSQYDDYADFRNQRRHVDRELDRSVVANGGGGSGRISACQGAELQCWPTAR